MVAVCVEAGVGGVGHVGGFEPGISFYGVLEVGGVVWRFGVRRLLLAGGGEEWRVVVIAWKIEIHAYTCRNEEFVRDRVLVGP